MLRARQAYDETPPMILRTPSAFEIDDADIIVESKPVAPPLRDPLPVLSVKLEQLARARTTWEAAGITASALVRTLSARAVLVHLHDDARGELRIIGAQGTGAQDLLGAIEPVSDCVFTSAAITNGKPVRVELDGLTGRLVAHRHTVLRATTIDVVPVVVGGRCVAVIEAIDIASSWKQAALRALSFAAERLASVVG